MAPRRGTRKRIFTTKRNKTTTSNTKRSRKPTDILDGEILDICSLPEFTMDRPPCDGSEHSSPDAKTVIGYALEEIAIQKEEFNKAFQDLNEFFISQGMPADQPCKYAIQELLEGKITDDEIRKKIAEYILLKLEGLMRFLNQLRRTSVWDSEVAFYVAEKTKEVKEDLGVEVTELEEISLLAEKVPNESFTVAKSEYLKNRVRRLLRNTRHLDETLREWVKNPTPAFSCCDVLGYDKRYD